MVLLKTISFAISLTLPLLGNSACPFLNLRGQHQKDSDLGMAPHPLPPEWRNLNENNMKKSHNSYYEALKTISLEDVQADIRSMLHTSQDFWPADYGNYGPFMIRLAWHQAGSYRSSDGRGGSDGGRQRFEPEESWDDNTNLDKARKLLWPIKQKYGQAISWADLFILTGTTAIEDMGGPVLGFCSGRVDDEDGSASQPLGPSPYQEKLAPCETNGDCKEPLGATTVGLIYVNPEGPMGQPVPEDTFPQIRDTFARMGMNDTETVALIGGGHAFGKAHGACPNGPGPSPKQNPENPWPGNCGTGKGNDTFTSGFEGPWTTNPTSWDNQYFKNLLDYEWEVVKGPGGHNQWMAKSVLNPDASPIPTECVDCPGCTGCLTMLTSDISLLYDPSYLSLVKSFASNLTELNIQFSHAWYKLTSRDMGPVTRCKGDQVPPAQPFQYPLPPPLPTDELPNFELVKEAIKAVIRFPNYDILKPDEGSNYGPLFVRLAWQCMNTYRATDYMGGCNGARIRASPQNKWESNNGLDTAMELLQPVKNKFGDSLSWADLIALSGTTFLEMASGKNIAFTGGRTDADYQNTLPTPEYLQFRLSGGSPNDTIANMEDATFILGLTPREFVALVGGGHSLGQVHTQISGFVSGSWTSNPLVLDNEYFKNLINFDWTEIGSGNKLQYTNGQNLYMLRTDMLIKWNPSFKAIAEEFIFDEESFKTEFVNAWTKLMNSDMF